MIFYKYLFRIIECYGSHFDPRKKYRCIQCQKQFKHLFLNESDKFMVVLEINERIIIFAKEMSISSKHELGLKSEPDPKLKSICKNGRQFCHSVICKCSYQVSCPLKFQIAKDIWANLFSHSSTCIPECGIMSWESTNKRI